MSLESLHIQQPGTAIMEHMGNLFIAEDRVITVYTQNGAKITQFPQADHPINILGVIRETGHIITATNSTFSIWQGEEEGFLAVSQDSGEPSTTPLEYSCLKTVVLAFQHLICTPTRVVISTENDIQTFGFKPETHSKLSIWPKSQKITALAPLFEGFVSGDASGKVRFWPSILFDKSTQELASAGEAILMLTSNPETLFIQTKNDVTCLHLASRVVQGCYKFPIASTGIVWFNQQLLAINNSEVYVVQEDNKFELIYSNKELGGITAFTCWDDSLALAGKNEVQILKSTTARELALSHQPVPA